MLLDLLLPSQTCNEVLHLQAVKAAEMSHGPDHSLTKECDDLLSHTEQFVQEAIPLVQRAILRKHLKSSSITFLKI